MSRELPEKPNLEYLKKQAKELLRSKRHGKLAEAQHALANDYGFATWAKLKSHVEALELTPAETLNRPCTAAVISSLCFAPFLTTRRATLRQTLPISRSRIGRMISQPGA